MHARASDLADGVQPGKAGAAVEIGRDAAHQVVRGRRHRDRLARPVQTPVAHRAVDRGEAAGEELRGLVGSGPQVCGVEEDRTTVLQLHLPGDRPRHHIAGGELAVRVRVEREAPAALVDQGRALAADGLRDQERLPGGRPGGVVRAFQHRRVELEELQLGHVGPCAQGGGDPVAGRHGGVRGVRVQLARTAGGEHHGIGIHPFAHAVDVRCRPGCRDIADQQVDTRDAAVVQHEVDQERVLDHADIARPQPCDEGLLDRRARGVAARVQDARVRVGGFEALDEVAVGAAVERDAEGDQLADARGPLVDQHPHGLGVAESGSRGQGVADVVLGAVVVEHHTGDAALRVAGVGVLEHVLGHERHPAAVLAPRGGRRSARRCRCRRRRRAPARS